MKSNFNLTWHMAAKDLRQMAPVTAVWLTFVVAAALVVRLAAIPNDVALAGDVRSWMNGMRLLQGFLSGSGALLAVLLMAQLVQEDSLIGTEAMWLTRPISSGRLLAAKLLGAAVMLIVAPVVGLVPIWLASGFSVSELASTAWSVVAGQSAMILLAGGLAALTRDLGKFIFGLVGLTLVGVVRMAFPIERDLAAEVIESRGVLLQIFTPAVVVAAGGIQYFTRRMRWAWTMLVGGLLMVVAVSVVWPWGTFAGWPGVTSGWPSGRGAALAQPVRVEEIVVAVGGGAAKTICFQSDGGAAKDEFVMPWNGAVELDGQGGATIRGGIEAGARWGAEAARRVLGFAPNGGPLSTAMELRQSTPADLGGFGTGGKVTGALRVARVRARVLGEWPWQAGASAWAGSSFTRVVGVREEPRAEHGEVRIEERDALPGGLQTIWTQGRGDGAMRRDCFVLVNRRLGIFQAMRLSEAGAMQTNGLLLAERTLGYDVPVGVGDDWARDAVIAKVRFEVLERWTKRLAGEPVAAVEEEKKP